MKNLNLDLMTDEELVQNNGSYRLKFMLSLFAGIILFALGNFPVILGEYYSDNSFFKMSFIVFVIYCTRIFPKMKATNKELGNRNLK